MTSMARDGASMSTGPDACEAAETAISAALSGLDELHALPVSEHVERFEAMHSALTDALTSAEQFSAANGHGS